jgi:hypothetical protein
LSPTSGLSIIGPFVTVLNVVTVRLQLPNNFLTGITCLNPSFKVVSIEMSFYKLLYHFVGSEVIDDIKIFDMTPESWNSC